jgi:hypothetical protein
MKDHKELGYTQYNLMTPLLYILYLKGIVTEEEIKKFGQHDYVSDWDEFMEMVRDTFYHA